MTDIADIIAGELKVSRGTAYEMMRAALAAQPAPAAAQPAEPVAWLHPDYAPGVDCNNGMSPVTTHKINGWKPLYAAPAAVPPGYVLVPIEPTEAMLRAGQKITWSFPAGPVYRAMIAAAGDKP